MDLRVTITNLSLISAKRIKIIQIPPHSSDQVQPLNLEIYGVFKGKYQAFPAPKGVNP
ncbi:hypothetical protein TVAG_413270 [Trichomonas vaginalis G3]|uniref:DDE-1 domain-containing protein n=1 Tax=Trichomonas vaginalis (strain ATCC PRA-98 / G3) TaxID=412133 RepID=A2G3X3_TRIV3|nr:DDE endonuclease family [Trichomonas vaginalis G3]EAX88147.1 hypothetical protein TVAG_413270 [Trichomonas vaginalis G3]KAI5545074.1 DDE endonuclease family [Trichomonas vaginalis G3]|eukprot:XP_001301077.1 hypothetical protein [Trichomonas vaginalis G3]